MKLRKNIQKIGALAGSGLMATLSVASPVAADLGDLPQPFIQDGEFDGNLVVGEEAQTEDVLGAIDIASSFQAEATSPVSVGGGGSVTVEGGEDFQEYVGDTFSQQNLDDSDLEGFADTDVHVDDNDYDYEEILEIDGSGSENQIATSGITSYSEDENYEQEAFMELGNGDLRYRLDFEDPVPNSSFSDDDMEVEFLGRQVEVEDIGTSSDEVTIQTSDEYTLEVGDSVEVDGHTVTLERVGESSVLVDVDGQQKALQYGSSDSDNDATFDEADDFEVVVDSAFYEDGASNNLAVLELGTDNTETYQDGDALEIFGGSDEDDEATYVWDISTQSNNELEYLGVELNLDHKRVRDSPDEDERNAIPLEGELELPNNRAALQFAGWDDSEMEDYEDIEVDFVNEDKDEENDFGSGTTAVSGDFLQISADNPNTLTVDGEEVEEVSMYSVPVSNTGFTLDDSSGSTDTTSITSLSEEAFDADGDGSIDTDDFTTTGANASETEVTSVTVNTDATVDLTVGESSQAANEGDADTYNFGIDYVHAPMTYYDDGDDEFFAGHLGIGSGASNVEAVSNVDIDISDETVPINVQTGSGDGGVDADSSASGTQLDVQFDFVNGGGSDEDIVLSSTVDSNGFSHFGGTSSDAEAGDFEYDYTKDNSYELSGTDDEARRTAYGVTFEDAESMLDSDEFDMSVPAAGQEANLIVRSTDTQISSGSSDSGAVELNRIPVGLGVLDSDVVSNGEVTADGPHIVVGGPYANTAASALLGNPSSSEIEQMFSPGQATIRMFDDANAMLVAGYNPQDTVRASRVVADYQDYSEELTGSEVELVFDGSEDIEFQAPSMNGSQ